ncbi:GNAT family protein [Clostridium perfringens]|nr:GNAT family N-acetyltransferase [Clostridium perfringens]EJT5920936.1 GNAT family N-acetyltransferase [Clostridium perfringens]MDK0960214.1 GNAT family protein [Clostridium perfringens]MDM0503867.1 GNAT family protein [Clostridium perfringens]
MYRYSDLKIRKFTKDDIPDKIKWINDSKNNTYLHYDLPLEYEKTLNWFERTKDRDDRFDAVIEYNGTPVGLVGLLNIDMKNMKAEDYIIVGEHKYKGKGIATRAGHLIQLYAFEILNLNKVYAYTEVDNEKAIKLDLRRGFEIEGCLKSDLCMNGRYIDRYCLGVYKSNYIKPKDVYFEECF